MAFQSLVVIKANTGNKKGSPERLLPSKNEVVVWLCPAGL